MSSLVLAGLHFFSGIQLASASDDRRANSRNCVIGTIGTCAIWDCDVSRNAECESSICICKQGYCALDGNTCTTDATRQYKSIEGVYKIVNVRYPNLYLMVYETKVGQDMRKYAQARETTDEASQFTIWLPPPESQVIMLYSKKWDNMVCSMRHDGMECPDHDSNQNLDMLGLRLYRAPFQPMNDTGTTFLMFANVDDTEGIERFGYIPEGQQTIKPWVSELLGETGSGGYWQFEPELPEEVQKRFLDWHGPPCKENCAVDGLRRVTVAGSGGVRASATALTTALLVLYGLLY